MDNLLTFDEAVSYVKSLDVYGSILGLSNMRKLAEYLDNPQDGLKFIHVTGTNGKGSVCAFLSNILVKSGYRVGAYNSPAVLSDTDQFSINTEPISDDLYAEAASLVKDACVRIVADGGVQPTRFEVETMTAFVAFYLDGCDIVVLETGLGGQDDATNIITTAVLHVFTSISLDHSQVLGNTITEIAKNKSGIIKTSAPVVLYDSSNEVTDVICKKCEETEADVYIADNALISNVVFENDLVYFDLPTMQLDKLSVSMKGAYQPTNAMIAVCAADILAMNGYRISDDDIREGLREANIPFRFEIKKLCTKNGEVDIILDGAHNPDGTSKFIDSLNLIYPDRRLIFITGIFKDKDYNEMARITGNRAEKVFIIENKKSSRALKKEILADTFKKYNDTVVICDSVEEAIDMAADSVNSNDNEFVIACFGSLSWLNDAKKHVEGE